MGSCQILNSHWAVLSGDLTNRKTVILHQGDGANQITGEYPIGTLVPNLVAFLQIFNGLVEKNLDP